MPPEHTYDYAIVRVVPRVERGEMMNVGVILSSPGHDDFLEARIHVDEDRLRALDPSLELATVREHLAVIPRVCKGGEEAGPIGALTPRNRFRWLVSPRSTMIQMSPVHTGRTADPATALDRLLEKMVLNAPGRQPPV